MAKTLIEVMDVVSKLEYQIAEMKSIMAARHYNSMPENEKKECSNLLSKRQEKLSHIMRTIAKSGHVLEV